MKGHLYQNPSSGTWYARIDGLRKPDGSRRQLRFKARTKRELENIVAKAIADVERGVSVSRDRMTVSNLLEKWLATKKNAVRLRAFESYADQIRLYLKPAFGGQLASRLSTGQVQEAFDTWLNGARLDGKPGPRTVRTARLPINVLSMAMRYGLSLGVCSHNPVLGLTLPPRGKPEKPEVDTERAGTLLRALRGTRMFVPAWLAFTTGMRRCEIIGLRWKFVDLDRGLVQRLKSYIKRKGQTEYEDVKTVKSRRKVPLSPITVNLLLKHREAQTKRLALLGITDLAEVPVFDNGLGQHWHPDTFSGNFADALKKGGIPHLKLHGSRHGFSTVALEEDVARKVVVDILGQESEYFNEDVYTTAKLDLLREGVARVSDALVEFIIDDSPELVV